MPSDNIAWFLNQMVNLYNGNGSSFTFTINKQSFDFVGMPYSPQEQDILLPSDTTVDINEFISIINFVFAKDIAWERMPVTEKSAKKGYTKTNFSKRTLCKYISLIDHYGLHASRSTEFLNSIGYPVLDAYPGPVENEKDMFAHTELFDILKYM